MANKRPRGENRVDSSSPIDVFSTLTQQETIQNWMTPNQTSWRIRRYLDVVDVFQRIAIEVKYMDDPDRHCFHAWHEIITSRDVPEGTTGVIEEAVDALLARSKGSFHGWADLTAAFCFLKATYENDNFKDVVKKAMEMHNEYSDSNHGSGRTISRLKKTIEMLEDDLQKRCVFSFFDFLHAGDFKKALAMKDALSYPPYAQTREEKQQAIALEILRDQRDDETF